MLPQIDLMEPCYAYMFGFLQADGSLEQSTRNRGKIRVEVSERDRSILEAFSAIVPVYSSMRTRTRNTNFKSRYASVVWTVYDMEFRRSLEDLGIVAGRKSEKVSIPSVAFSAADYFRGLVDADGSLGLTANGFPFVSLTTASDSLAHGYIRFIGEVTGQ